MRVTKEKAAEHRESIVAAAAKLFREAGIDGVGVAELTAAAGLTHGGFYRHFDSKDALFVEACIKSFDDAASMMATLGHDREGDERFRRGYLSDSHLDGTPFCPVAALGAEVARHSPEVQSAFAQGLRKLLSLDGRAVGSDAWNKNAAELATLIGTFIMARAVRKVDKALSTAMVHAGLTALNSGKRMTTKKNTARKKD